MGHWTNKLYEHFKAHNSLKVASDKTNMSAMVRIAPERPLEIMVDGPFGSPSSNIYR